MIVPVTVNAAADPNWKRLYLIFLLSGSQNGDISAILQNEPEESEKLTVTEYTLFDINEDYIPELFCKAYEANGEPLLLIYAVMKDRIGEIGRFEIGDDDISISSPTYPEFDYLILSRASKDGFGGGEAYVTFYRLNFYEFPSRVISREIASVSERLRHGEEGVYYPVNEHHPNDFEYTYTFQGENIEKERFIRSLQLGTALNFISIDRNSNGSVNSYFYYTWNIISDTPALYMYSNRTPVESAPHSSNPELIYSEIYYDVANILENDNEFTSLITYPSYVRSLSVNPESGVNLVMVNGNFIDCGVVVKDGVFMLQANPVLEAIGRYVSAVDEYEINILKTDPDSRYLNVGRGFPASISAKLKFEEPPLKIDRNYYLPTDAFTENLEITQETVSNLRSEDDKANIIVLETIYPEDTKFISVETVTENITVLIAEAVRQNLPNYNEEVNKPVYKFNLGRYYVYDSEYVNGQTLLVNKYTGQIFTVQAFYGETYSIKAGIRINAYYGAYE
jgi:hypothetical protein